MAQISDPEISVERLADKVREGAMRRSSSGSSDDDFEIAVSSASPTDERSFKADRFSFAPTEIPRLALQPQFEPRANDQYHVRDLLQYHDRAFIQNAFRAILKRGPDATGYTAFIEALRAGRLNKIDILARLRFSSEGRAKKVQIKGLLLPALIRQTYRVPILGYLINLCVSFARLPNMVRNQQQFEAHALAQQQQIVDYSNQINIGLTKQQERLEFYANQMNESLAKQQQQLSLLTEEQKEALDAIRDQLAETMRHYESRLVEESARRQEQVGQLSSSFRSEVEQLARDLMIKVERVFQKQQEVRTEQVLQGERLTRLLEEARKRLPAPFDQEQLKIMADEERHSLDAFYVSLEDQFRGDRAEIKKRLKVYLPLLKRAELGTEQTPILDVGSGRGEWLGLLQEEKLQASGVDFNRVLVAECRARGLLVAEDDVMNYLRSLPDSSIGAVTGFHIIEHLPFETLLKFLDETVRVIKPGGAVLFETPNPQNVLVGSCNFYFDPTHRNPLPAPVMKFFLESRGLSRVEIIPLNPSDMTKVEGEGDLVKRFNEYFYGPMDYAAVGWKL